MFDDLRYFHSKDSSEISLSNEFLLACMTCDKTYAKKILEKNLNPTEGYDYGYYPLIYSTKNSHYSLVKLLLKHEADVNVTDYSGMTSLMHAANKGCYSMVKLFLKQKAKVNMTDNFNYTALHFAVKHDYICTVRLLLTHKANPCIKDISGNTPMFWADLNKNQEMVSLLDKYIVK